MKAEVRISLLDFRQPFKNIDVGKWDTIQYVYVPPDLVDLFTSCAKDRGVKYFIQKGTPLMSCTVFRIPAFHNVRLWNVRE
jgi:hypothetical protein